MAVFFCWLSFSWVPGRTTQSQVKTETFSSVGRTGWKCAPIPPESPSRALCRASLRCWPWTIHNSSPWCFHCHCRGANWRREMKRNKRTKEGYSCLDLIISAEKMSNHGSEKQNLWGVLLQAEKAASEGRRALICAFQQLHFNLLLDSTSLLLI